MTAATPTTEARLMSDETQKVSAYYIEGIKSGREAFRKYGLGIAREELDTLKRTIKGFGRTSPVGQYLRGELDFWRNQLALNTAALSTIRSTL